MKNIMIKILLVLIIFGTITACSKVPAGNVGVKVFLLGGDKGVDTEELTPGRYWIGWNEDLFIFPTFTQNVVWTKDENEGSENDESITFQTKEGLAVNADIGVAYAIEPTKVNEVFQKYRKGINEITDIYLRNMIRDAFVIKSSTLGIASVYGSGKSDLMKSVIKDVKAKTEPLGIIVENIYYVGILRLPDSVVASIDNKIKATQEAQQRRNEVETAKADADKVIEHARGEAQSIIAIAKAQAEANTLVANSLTPELVQYKSIEKWDGVRSKYVGSGIVPIMDIK